jgi:uncharacterized membrane protein/ribosomal protein L40E
VTIASNRTIGGIAACFILIGVVNQVIEVFQYAFPSSNAAYLALSGISDAVGVLAFVGLLLFFIAMYGFSRDYGERGIFNNLMYGIVAVIVAGVIAVVYTVIILLFNIGNIIPNSSSSPSSTQISSSVLHSLLPVFPVFAVIGLIWIWFNVRAFNLLADKSTVVLFRTGAKVLLAGAALTIAIAIVFALIGSSYSWSYSTLLILFIPGGLVQDVAWALLAMAYFRIKPPAPQALSTQPSFQAVAPASVPAVSGQVKYCRYCGAQNPTDAIYCTRCGTKNLSQKS